MSLFSTSLLHAGFISVVLCSVLPGTVRAGGYLHAAGIYIADGNNNQIVLRGMGLGGWLVPEGYMLQTSGFANSPTQIRNVVAGTVGNANADQFFSLYRQQFIQRKDIDSLARWGFNSVRLPMHYNLLSPSPGVYIESGFTLIDSLLNWCESNGMYLILDLHCAPGGQNGDNISDYMGFPSLWDSQDFQSWTAELWKTLAARYAAREWIGGYDLLNETAWSFPSGNKPLRDLLVRITDSIRTVDRNHMIFAEGNWYATDFSGLTPAWDANMAWSFHKYWNINDYSAFQSYLQLRANTNTPLWLGESGENSNQWFSDAIMLLEAYRIGWSWWTLKKIESISCPLSVKKHAGYETLLKYWSGQGSQPTVTAAMNALTAQALLFDADVCSFHPDFLFSLFQTPFADRTKPWGPNTVPGVIYAVNYDLGRNGTAYFDNDFQNTQGVSGPAYNSGWTYRNDGVDIQACTDVLSNGYDVGWTNPGEFLAYTINVQTTGTYTMKARVASGGSGGSFKLVQDDADLTGSVAVPGTGGWQNWQTVTAGPFVLIAGTHDVKVNFLSTNVNLNRLEFNLVAAGVDDPADRQTDGSEGTPLVFLLEQNYPNPFNPTTVIRYKIPDAAWVKLAVYDILEREVAVLVDERKPAGSYAVRIDGKGLATGVYYYRLDAAGQRARYTETRNMLLMK
jgi:endoglucanase